MKTFYYVIELELDENEAIVSGIKFIRIYELIQNKIELIKVIECDYEDNSIDIINEFMKENHIYPNNYNLYQL